VAKRPFARRPLAKEGATSRSTEARVRALEKAVDENRHDLDLQFRRIAQMQIEIDALKKSNGKR